MAKKLFEWDDSTCPGAKRAGRLIVRVIGLVRVKAKVGLRNLAYNLDRYCVLVGT